jgi:hypothetical protein
MLSQRITIEADEAHLLLVASRSVMALQRVSVLRSLCKKNRLTVGRSGKRGACVQKDYVEAILLYVSSLIALQLQALTCKQRQNTRRPMPTLQMKRPGSPSAAESRKHQRRDMQRLHHLAAGTCAPSSSRKHSENPLTTSDHGVSKVAPAMALSKNELPVQDLPASVIHICLFKQPRDCLHIVKTEVQCGALGEVDLELVEKQLQITGSCKVSSYEAHRYHLIGLTLTCLLDYRPWQQ